MTTLVAGLVIFFAVHSLRMIGLRDPLQQRLGKIGYRIVYTVISLTGLVLIVRGFGHAPFAPIYTPPSWSRYVAFVLVPLAFICFAASGGRSNLRVALKHPLTVGVLLWATAHLLANGDLRSLLLFGSFWLWSVLLLFSLRHESSEPMDEQPLRRDAIPIIAGLLVAAAVAWFHAKLFGMPVILTLP